MIGASLRRAATLIYTYGSSKPLGKRYIFKSFSWSPTQAVLLVPVPTKRVFYDIHSEYSHKVVQEARRIRNAN